MQTSGTFLSHPLRARWYGTLSGPGLHAVHVFIQMSWGPWLKSKSGKTLRNTWSKMADDSCGKINVAVRTRRNLELNWIFICLCLNKIKIAERFAQRSLNKINDNWVPRLPCDGVRALSVEFDISFFGLSGVRGWALSSQLRLLKAEILSVFRLAEF